jgi:hypothetical protein
VPDALSDEALAQVYGRTYHGDEDWLRHMLPDQRDATMRAMAAVRDHILRVLAEQAGDPDALRRAAYIAYNNGVGDYDAAYPTVKEDCGRVVQAVAIRAVAPLAVEVLALREGLRRCGELFGAIIGDWTDPRFECHEGIDIADKLLARPLPNAAKRAEAEHNLAVAYLAGCAAQAEWAAVWNRLQAEGRTVGDPIHGMFVRDGDDEGRRLVSEATARWEAASARLDQAGQALRALDGDPRA